MNPDAYSDIIPIGKETFALRNQPLHRPRDFGAAIRHARKRDGLTQRDLALSVGTGERFIVDLENGKETVRLGKALEVAAALGLKIQLVEDT